MAEAIARVVLGSSVYPLVVEPLFNHFTPMSAGPLRSSILALAREDGVRLQDVLVADASRRTTSVNAYVDGFGATRRVVVYDTLLRDLPPAQVRSVVAHELGHAKDDDVLTGTLLGAAGSIVGVGLLGVLMPLVRRRTRTAGAADPGAVPALLALVAVGTLVAAPLQNAISRAIEARADRTALVTTHDPAAFVAMQRELVLAAHADPSPPWLTQWWFGTHDSMVQRVALAEALTGWRPGR